MRFLENFFGWHIGWFEPERYSHWYSVWHILALIAIVSFFVFSCLHYKNKSYEAKIKFLKTVAIVMIVLEVLRMVWRTHSYYGYIRNLNWKPFNAGEIISITLCAQLVWFSSVTILINKPKWNDIAYYVFFPINMASGVLALFVPTSIFNSYYPFYHFSTLQTFIQHSLILFIPIFLLSTGLLKPQFKRIYISFAFFSGFFIIAHFSNMIWDRNFMWTTFFDMVPGFENFKFPFTFVPLMIGFVPYCFACHGVVFLVNKLKAAKTTKQSQTINQNEQG